MAATVTLQATLGNQPTAPTFIDRIRVVGDAAPGYPNPGGYFLDLVTKLPGKTILGVAVMTQITGAFGLAYDRATDKLRVFVLTTGIEVANGVNLATLDVELIVFSR
jgi:hypothetical protein